MFGKKPDVSNLGEIYRMILTFKFILSKICFFSSQYPPPGILMPQSLCGAFCQLLSSSLFNCHLLTESFPGCPVLSYHSLVYHLFIASGIACNFSGRLCCPRYKWHEGRNLVCFHIKLCLIHCKYSKIF